jgi:hypothetical protein
VASWAIFAYIGIGNTIIDTWIGLTKWLYVETGSKTSKSLESQEPDLDWRAVLYHGDAKSTVPLAARGDIAAVTPVERKLA